MNLQTIALFPLHTVLFPGGPLLLRVFETRYLDMIRRSLKGEQDFGIIQIQTGSEGETASIYSTGTIARIVDWSQGDDGILGIVVHGGDRFRVLQAETLPDGLNVGRVNVLDEDPGTLVPVEYALMAEVLEKILNSLEEQYASVSRDMRNAGWVANRLAELLPLDMVDKQKCLEIAEPLTRLRQLQGMIRETRADDE
ncbi:MAG: LON peptidase substrate-binding domain-containing protein [Gammaproteobacteria bacterium]|nr:LON peptidase substrate-binding domain-containing protein [Pseudomonadota bacterium]MCZ6537950.1 LON peptidase substrate-binding domain-containing protein [Gammaproteobacteria bacterium]MCZ6880174.1 LON peptidase substrate-binding domain-containing protein [Gammaproteobacteria bacterium]TDJ11447.1 MAG: peptidase S16 [Gammaproteobacteria bacterium]